jgi:hypothetical protein
LRGSVMRKTLATLGLMSSLLVCAQANAAVVITVNPPPSNVFNVLPGLATETFDNPALLGLTNFTTPFATFAQSPLNIAGVTTGTTSGVAAAPFLNPSPGFVDTTQYLAVTGIETVTFAKPVTEFGLYWGSVDSYNHISFNNNPGSYSGSDVSPLLHNGAQTNLSSNGYVLFTGLNPFTVVTLSSGGASFEVDNLQANLVGAPPVPETSTWLMMILGFLGVGFVAYRRKTNTMNFRIA